MNALFWSIKRELWENRSIYVAPLAGAALFLIGFLVALVGLPARMRAAAALGPLEQRQAIEQPYVLAAALLMGVAMVVAVVYCLDALYGERRDRSILFWKSLPLSDWTTVCAKASIPTLVIPVVTFTATVATQFVMLVMSSAVLEASGVSAAPLWTHVPLVRTAMTNFGHLVLYHGLWYAPFFGWLLMVSAWAHRVPFMWATLPPVALGVVERVGFDTGYFAALVRNRLLPAPGTGPSGAGMTMDVLGTHAVSHYLSSPGLWGGLAVTGAFLFVAVRLRRSRGPL